MEEIEIEQHLFSSLLKINYDKCFIKTAQNFVESLSLVAGADKKESLQISLLLEECLVFIIDKYIDCRAAAHIEICFKVIENEGVYIEITDIGPPIHERMIPSFNISDENSEAGLWYKLVLELSDEFLFINRHGAGWLIKIRKKIENITFRKMGNGNEESNSVAGRENTFGEKHARMATVEDIPAFIDLAYLTYRYSYMFKEFYNAELLKKYMDEKMYDIMLIEHGSKVIGAYAVKYSDVNRTSAEVGNAMISPEYRNASAMVVIFRELGLYLKTNPYNCDFFVSTAFTSHIRSQKALARINNGFKPLMIYLNAAPRPEFVGIEHANGGRESGLIVYHLNDKLKPEKIYVTAESHIEIIGELIANTGNSIQVVAEFAEPSAEESQISVKHIGALQLAAISLESVGRDWFTSLNRQIFAAIVSGVESIFVTIPASAPLPKNMEKMMADLNLIFCGLSLRSLDKIDHTYCLSTKPIDFSTIKLYDPVALKLLRQIEQNYNDVVGK